MRILVVQPRPLEREHIVRALAGQPHEVKYASDAATALHLLELGGVDVVIVEHAMTGITGHEIVRRLRAREDGRHTWTVVMNSAPTSTSVQAAFDAGADDYVVGRCSKDELLARIGGRQRIDAWLKLVGATSGGTPRADATRAWQDAVELMTSTFGDMLGLPVSIARIAATPEERTAIAVLPLTLASTGQEVTVRAALLESGAGLVREQLLGRAEAPAAETQDMMREICNLAGGVWKRLAAVDGQAYTLGLPADAHGWQVVPAPLATREWAVLASGRPILHLGLEVQQRRSDFVPIAGMREGMVLRRDVLNASGGVLLRSGTCLTESHLSRLSSVLGATTRLEVAAPLEGARP